MGEHKFEVGDWMASALSPATAIKQAVGKALGASDPMDDSPQLRKDCEELRKKLQAEVQRNCMLADKCGALQTELNEAHRAIGEMQRELRRSRKR